MRSYEFVANTFLLEQKRLRFRFARTRRGCTLHLPCPQTGATPQLTSPQPFCPRARIYEALFDAVLRKPVQPNAVIAMVRKVATAC